jgi:hypothetical protein
MFAFAPVGATSNREAQRGDGRQQGGGMSVLEAFADCREGANGALRIENVCVAGKKL